MLDDLDVRRGLAPTDHRPGLDGLALMGAGHDSVLGIHLNRQVGRRVDGGGGLGGGRLAGEDPSHDEGHESEAQREPAMGESGRGHEISPEWVGARCGANRSGEPTH